MRRCLDVDLRGWRELGAFVGLGAGLTEGEGSQAVCQGGEPAGGGGQLRGEFPFLKPGEMQTGEGVLAFVGVDLGIATLALGMKAADLEGGDTGTSSGGAKRDDRFHQVVF